MPLLKRPKTAARAMDGGEGEGAGAGVQAERRRSRRERVMAFFSRARRQRMPQKGDSQSQSQSQPETSHTEAPTPESSPPRKNIIRDSKFPDSPPPAALLRPVLSDGEVAGKGHGGEETLKTPLPTPPPEPEEEKIEYVTEEHLHSIYSGAPHFSIQHTYDVYSPVVTYPWGNGATTNDTSDSAPLAHAAFHAATLVPQYAIAKRPDEHRPYEGYEVDASEVPSMLSAQGLEPGTVGFGHFLQLPISDSLVTDLQQMQSSDGSLQALRNSQFMQHNPEKLGIRLVRMNVVYERLVEFCDLHEAFADSPEPTTILNNQSSGDLYATLFGKLLMPPRYDGTTSDPTGLKVQIDTLLRILSLKGVWYDFSLVEWRIRLGQILWSDPDAPDHGGDIWSERDLLLLQITLACELLLRLDAVSPSRHRDNPTQMPVSVEEYQGFHNLGTKKTDWDLIVARRFLENILVVPESTPAQAPRARGLLSMLGPVEQPAAPRPDIVILPRHQSRQLSGLLAFAEAMQWPDIEMIVQDLAHKLGVINNTPAPETDHQTYERFLDPSTPTSISVYGTPLPSPLPASHTQDSYFSNTTRPALSRSSTARSLLIPLSTMLLAHAADDAASSLNIGGWLSRSWLTGLVLPGEAISHFLMSTLLENDKLAIAALGDSANLYGGFIFSGRSWWSKSSVVGRVLACTEGVVECMGWISIPTLPEGLSEAWYPIVSEEVQPTRPYRITSEVDLVAKDSFITPDGDTSRIQSKDLTPIYDNDTLPAPSIKWLNWNLTPSTPQTPDLQDTTSLAESDPYTATLTFSSSSPSSPDQTLRTLTLKHDVHFITSFPCTPPPLSPSPISSPTNIDNLKRSLSHASIPGLAKRNASIRDRNASNRSSLLLSRRNSHGFEPLMSHPPDSEVIKPVQTLGLGGEEADWEGSGREKKSGHFLHKGFAFKILSVGEVLKEGFDMDAPSTEAGPSHSANSNSTPKSSSDSHSNSTTEAPDKNTQESKTKPILILDARGSSDLELLARGWCAEKGYHALIGRVGRTCLACCVREARGVGVGVVVRVG